MQTAPCKLDLLLKQPLQRKGAVSALLCYGKEQADAAPCASLAVSDVAMSTVKMTLLRMWAGKTAANVAPNYAWITGLNLYNVHEAPWVSAAQGSCGVRERGANADEHSKDAVGKGSACWALPSVSNRGLLVHHKQWRPGPEPHSVPLCAPYPRLIQYPGCMYIINNFVVHCLCL